MRFALVLVALALLRLAVDRLAVELLPLVFFFAEDFLEVDLLLEPGEVFEPFEVLELFAAALLRGSVFMVIPVARWRRGFGIFSWRPSSAALPITVPNVPPTRAPIGPAMAAPISAPLATPATVLRT